MYTIKGWSHVTNDAISPKIELPTKKGKLVFFQYGLGADWREFAATILGTSSGHDSWDSLKEPVQKGKYGSRKEVHGLVQLYPNDFWDAGVTSQRGTDFSSKKDKYCSHDCQSMQEGKTAKMLQEGKVICIKTEFSSGILHFSVQLTEMVRMVNKVEYILASKEIDCDVAFVGHSLIWWDIRMQCTNLETIGINI